MTWECPECGSRVEVIPMGNDPVCLDCDEDVDNVDDEDSDEEAMIINGPSYAS